MMKAKNWILLAVLMMGLTLANAQKKDDRVGGIRGGFQSAVMVESGSKADSANNLKTFYVGFFRDQKMLPFLFFGSGLEYFQNGFNYTNDSKRVLHMISIPLDLKVKIGPVFALGGIAGNFKVAEKIHIGDSKANPASGDKSTWFDAAAFAGVGLKLFFITIEARYHWGLIESNKGLYNRYLQIGAGISF